MFTSVWLPLPYRPSQCHQLCLISTRPCPGHISTDLVIRVSPFLFQCGICVLVRLRVLLIDFRCLPVFFFFSSCSRAGSFRDMALFCTHKHPTANLTVHYCHRALKLPSGDLEIKGSPCRKWQVRIFASLIRFCCNLCTFRWLVVFFVFLLFLSAKFFVPEAFFQSGTTEARNRFLLPLARCPPEICFPDPTNRPSSVVD